MHKHHLCKWDTNSVSFLELFRRNEILWPLVLVRRTPLELRAAEAVFLLNKTVLCLAT